MRIVISILVLLLISAALVGQTYQLDSQESKKLILANDSLSDGEKEVFSKGVQMSQKFLVVHGDSVTTYSRSRFTSEVNTCHLNALKKDAEVNEHFILLGTHYLYRRVDDGESQTEILAIRNNEKRPLRKKVKYQFPCEDKCALADEEGNLISEYVYDKIKRGGFKRFIVTKDGKQGVINDKLETIIGFDYDDIQIMDGYTYSCKKDGKVSLISNNGLKHFDSDFKTILNGHLQTLKVETQEGKWGFANWQGELIIDAIYDHVKRFDYGGVAVVTNDGKQGVINRKGEVFIPLKHMQIVNKKNGLEIRTKEGNALLDYQGTCLENCEFYETK